MTTLRQQMWVLLVTCMQCPKHHTFCSNHNGEQDKLRQEQDKLVTHESSSITITGCHAARWTEQGVQVVGHIVLHSVLTALHQTLAQPIRVWLGNVREEDTVTVGATEHHVR